MLGAPPSEDDLALDVAEARVAAKLFGSSTSVEIGRYRLLELVGRGGMGVVWGAWDPELERRVAIKLLAASDRARDRILDEARALAKLSHPNIVPIYDVGVVDERVYLVMEWVEGHDLRGHLLAPGRAGDRDIVDCYAQAARGLAAIHAAGLVHRDFKPDNAVIGRDGRVRVLDFGLASPGAGGTTELAGTRRYMAPEAMAGSPSTAAVDQYALCTSLQEAFTGREQPRWIAAIVARGTSQDPADRYPSMADVVVALGRHPGRVWRRRLVAGAVIAATASAFVLGRAGSSDSTVPTACSSSPEIAFTASARSDVARHLDSLGGFAAVERAPVLAILDERDHRRISVQQASCVAHDRGELPTAMYERRLTCLARARASLATIAEILQHATVESFPGARIAAGLAVDAETCKDVDQSLVAPPAAAIVPAVRVAEAALERARLLATATRPDATAAAEEARRLAEATGYAPLVARALLVEGRARMALEDPQAHATLDHAMRAAFAAQDDATAIEAFARAVYVAVRFEGRFAVDGAEVIEAVAARLGPNDVFARLLLRNNLAVARLGAGDRAGARTLLASAMSEWQHGERADDYELVSIPQNLALAIDDPASSVALFGQARTRAMKLVGNDHPKVIELDEAQAMFRDLDHARAALDDACTRLRTMSPHLVDERAECEYEAGWLADEASDHAAAIAHFQAVSTGHLEPLRATVATAMSSTGTRQSRVVATELERSAAEARAKADLPWPKILAGDAYVAAARVFETAGDRAGELRCWEAAKQLFEVVSIPFTARRLARARTALFRLTGDRASARAALRWYRSIGGYERIIAELRLVTESP